MGNVPPSAKPWFRIRAYGFDPPIPVLSLLSSGGVAHGARIGPLAAQHNQLAPGPSPQSHHRQHLNPCSGHSCQRSFRTEQSTTILYSRKYILKEFLEFIWEIRKHFHKLVSYLYNLS